MSEESVKVASLVEKLAGWVEAQPEYPYLFLADRARRKRAARIVAERLLLIPAIKPDPAGTDRATYRKQNQAVSHVVGGFKAKMSKHEQRMAADALKMKHRYAALGIERAHELALRFNAEFDQRVAMLAEMQRQVDEGVSPEPDYDGPAFEYEGESPGEEGTDVEADVTVPSTLE